MGKIMVKINIRKTPNNPNIFEFTVGTPAIKTQFRMPRTVLNQLRILIERTLTQK